VIGILNDRPHGPCINTKVDIQKVREAILDFLSTEEDDQNTASQKT
jgi:hypothetical protein